MNKFIQDRIDYYNIYVSAMVDYNRYNNDYICNQEQEPISS
jgi:hypothetical protein